MKCPNCNSDNTKIVYREEDTSVLVNGGYKMIDVYQCQDCAETFKKGA